MTDSATTATATVDDSRLAHRAAPPEVDQSVGLIRRITFFVVRTFLRLHLALWGFTGLYRFCQFFGTLEYWINHKRRKRVAKMIQRAFAGELNRKYLHRYTRAHFMRQRCDKTYYLLFDILPIEVLRSRFRILEPEKLDAAIERGKGGYFMLCHQGAVQICLLAMAGHGYPVTGVRDPNESTSRRMVQARWARKYSHLPEPVVLFAGDFVRQIYRQLQNNSLVGSALDIARTRDPRQKTVMVNAYGGQRPFLTGTLQIALRRQSMVYQALIIARDNFEYDLHLIGPLTDADHDRETPELLQRVMQQYADNVTANARKHPDQILRA